MTKGNIIAVGFIVVGLVTLFSCMTICTKDKNGCKEPREHPMVYRN